MPRGTITAVVGRSGAGKSTVASLLSRFYEPDSGAIWLGGKPADSFTRGEWAKAVALVSQEPVLFSGQSARLHCPVMAAPSKSFTHVESPRRTCMHFRLMVSATQSRSDGAAPMCR